MKKAHFLLCLLLTIVLTSSFSTRLLAASPTEIAALTALYNATDGANWTNNTNWLNGMDPCDVAARWFGVTCDGSGNVTEVNLGYNNLVGPLPPEIGDLIYLQRIFLYQNRINSSLPNELGNLVNLIYLNISRNELEGSIPETLGNLNNLEFLYLVTNSLSGNIPPELGNMTNLKNLSINVNNLSGSIPPELSNLLNLEVMSIAFNPQLTGEIPAELGNLANLQSLNLNSTSISGSIPRSLGNLSNLRYLYLSSTNLRGNIPGELGNLTNLVVLNLTSYQLECIELGLNRLCGLSSLIQVALPGISWDDFCMNGAGSCELDALTALFNATDGPNWTNNINWFNGMDPCDSAAPWHGITCDGNRNVTEINLSNNNLNGVIPSEIGNLSQLQKLWLWSNQISSIPPEIGDITVLKSLSLGSNLINSIPLELGSLSQLNYLELYDNQITIIPPELGNLSQLLNLNLNGNQISNIPPEIGNLSQLQYLSLGNNQISIIPPELGNLTLLQSLYLDHNQLNSIEPVIGNLPQLQYLHLNNNQVNSIPPTLGNLAQLIELRLHNNQIINIPSELGNLIQLEFLSLTSNQISVLPAELGNLSQLQILYLNNNQISNIPQEFGNLSNLSQLWLSANQLQCLEPALSSLCNNAFLFVSLLHNPGNLNWTDFCTTDAGACLPPSCTALHSPLNGATDVSINADLSWTAVTDATGYRLTAGTSSGGNDILNNENVGNVTTYNLENLPENTTIYVTIIPFNNDGDASGCTEESFTTECLTLWYADTDMDGYGDPNNSLTSCTQPIGYVANNEDCDDGNDAIHPQTFWYADSDSDGYGDPFTSQMSCTQPAGYVLNDNDCDDGNADITPETIWYVDADSDGYGNPIVSTQSCNQPAGFVLDNNDCDDGNANINPETIWYADADSDGYGDPIVSTQSCNQPAGFVLDNNDCDDGNANINPQTIWYADTDNDGFGDPNVTQTSCFQPDGYVLDNNDCDDTDPDVFPNPAVDHGNCETCVDGIQNGDETGVDCGGALCPECPCEQLITWDFADPADNSLTRSSAHEAPNITEQWLNYNGNLTLSGFSQFGNPFPCYSVYNGTSTVFDEQDYLQIPILATECNAITITRFSLDIRRNTDGIQYWELRSSADDFTSTLSDGQVVNIDQWGNYAVDLGDGIQVDTNYLELRLYLYGASAQYGRFYIDNLEVCGTLSPLSTETYYADTDGDGFGDPNNSQISCTQPADHVLDNTDCDDSRDDIYPFAPELCDGVDNDCNGQIEDAGECGLRITPKVYLQGPYNPTTGFMNDHLRDNNLLPQTEPYDALGYTLVGSGGETAEPSVFETTGPDAIVDWVFLELRDKSDPTMVLATRSALLQADGDVVNTDGVAPINFADLPPDDYYLVVKHRNHLGVMTAAPVALSATPTSIDFTTDLNQVAGGANGIGALPGGKLGLYSGDFNGNGQVQNTDYAAMVLTLGTAGYLPGDFDLNGQVQNTDLQLRLVPNIGRGAAFD